MTKEELIKKYRSLRKTYSIEIDTTTGTKVYLLDEVDDILDILLNDLQALEEPSKSSKEETLEGIVKDFLTCESIESLDDIHEMIGSPSTLNFIEKCFMVIGKKP